MTERLSIKRFNEIVSLHKVSKDGGIPYTGDDGYGPLVDEDAADHLIKELNRAIADLLSEREWRVKIANNAVLDTIMARIEAT